jgi:hypothetical protein
MKTNLTKTKTVLAATFLVGALTGTAQEKQEPVQMRKAGFGMKFSLLGLEDLNLTSSTSGGKTFLLSVNPHKNFRVEPEFAFAKGSGPSGTNVGDLNDKSVHYGGSLFYMFQQGHANFYFGPNYAISKVSYDRADYVSAPWPSNGYYKKTTINAKGTSVGFIAGAEYFFSKHFSLGTELGFCSRKYNPDTSKTDESRGSFTSGNLTVRTYF